MYQGLVLVYLGSTDVVGPGLVSYFYVSLLIA